MDVLENNPNSFGTDFIENKKILNQITIVRSKGLKNQIAGYITNFIKKQIKLKEEKADSPPEEKEDSPPEEKVDSPPEEKVDSPPEEKADSPPEEKVDSPPEEKVVTVSDESN